MKKEYGPKKGKKVFYASQNKGTITGTHKTGSSETILRRLVKEADFASRMRDYQKSLQSTYAYDPALHQRIQNDTTAMGELQNRIAAKAQAIGQDPGRWMPQEQRSGGQFAGYAKAPGVRAMESKGYKAAPGPTGQMAVTGTSVAPQGRRR